MSESSDEKTTVWVEDDQLPEDLQPGEEPGADSGDDSDGDLAADPAKPEDPLPEG